MSISNELVNKLVTVMNDEKRQASNTSPVRGTIVKQGSAYYVQIDGSDLLTPITTTVAVEDGERVLVNIINHTATVTGNISSPSASKGQVDSINLDLSNTKESISLINNTIQLQENRITALNTTITSINNTVTAQGNKITEINDTIESQNNTIISINNTVTSQGNQITEIDNTVTSQGNQITQIGDTITSQGNQITQINNLVTSQGNTITQINDTVNSHGNQLTQVDNTIKSINNNITSQGNKITEIDNTVTSQGNTITSQGNQITEIDDKVTSQGNDITTINNTLTLQGNTIDIVNSSFQIINGVVTGIKGVDTEWISTKDLESDHIRVGDLESKKADIDLANVNNAWIQNGIIKDGSIGSAAIHDGAITNVKIADATIEAAKIKSINADTITAGTIKTDRLIITGPDGQDSIVKAINIANGVSEAEVNSKQLQAASIDVVDLSAFKAKIADFDLNQNAIYSNKTSIKDPSSGIYISTTGLGIGNGLLTGKDESPIQMYADGVFKLVGKNGKLDFNAVTGDLELDVTKLKINSKSVATSDDLEAAKNENTTVLKVFSSNGTSFKDTNTKSVLTVIIYKGNNIITDETMLHEVIGTDSYLQWYYKKSNSDKWIAINNTDKRITNYGFTFTTNPVNTDQIVDYRCTLIDTPYTVFMLDQSSLDTAALS